MDDHDDTDSVATGSRGPAVASPSAPEAGDSGAIDEPRDEAATHEATPTESNPPDDVTAEPTDSSQTDPTPTDPAAAAEAEVDPDADSDAAVEGAAVRRPMLTRRGALLGAAGIVVAGGAGAGIAALRHHPKPATPPVPPAALVAALEAERSLVARVAVVSAAVPAQRTLLAQLISDHHAHEQALVAALNDFPGAAQSVVPNAPTGPATVAALAQAESQAAGQGASRARQLRGTTAALLASISACESAHAALLA
jgi:hypothetical protein